MSDLADLMKNEEAQAAYRGGFAEGFLRGVQAAARTCEKLEHRVPIPCPDGIEGCLVAHFKTRPLTNIECAEAIRKLPAKGMK